MSKALEEYGDQIVLKYSIKIALRMINDGQFTLEKIAEYSGLSIEQVKELAAGKPAQNISNKNERLILLEHFNTERPLYLLGSAVTQFTGMDLERIASWLRKMNKEAYYEDILEENLDTRLFQYQGFFLAFVIVKLNKMQYIYSIR